MPEHRLVTILANPDCPHCVHATEMVTEWCCDEGIPVAGVDLPHHPEAARRWNVEHSPSVVVEGDRRPRVFVGVPTHDEFLALTRP